MSGWKIDPERVVALLLQAQESRDRLGRAVRPKEVEEVTGGIFWEGYAGAVIAPLIDALVDLSALQEQHLLGIATLADTCLSGLSNTTLAYQAGMHDMAVEQQKTLLENADVLDGAGRPVGPPGRPAPPGY